MRKNYRINSLLLDKESMNLLNQIAESLKIRNSDLARMILTQKLQEIASYGASSFQLGVIGLRKTDNKPTTQINKSKKLGFRGES